MKECSFFLLASSFPKFLVGSLLQIQVQGQRLELTPSTEVLQFLPKAEGVVRATPGGDPIQEFAGSIHLSPILPTARAPLHFSLTLNGSFCGKATRRDGFLLVKTLDSSFLFLHV